MPTEQHTALRDLVTDMEAGRVQMLVIIGESNPVYTAPADLNFADAMAKVGLRMHSGLFLDETATLCHWHVPAAHYLEAWSDARSFDGTITIVQPLIQPMYGGKSAHEVIATLSERPERNGYDILREYWTANAPAASAASAASAAGAAGAAGAGGAGGAMAAQRATPSVRPSPQGQAGGGERGTQPSEQDVAAMVAAQTAPPPMTAEQRAAAQFERTWRKWLHDGFIGGTGFQNPQGSQGAVRRGAEVPNVMGFSTVTPAPSAPSAPAAPALHRGTRVTQCPHRCARFRSELPPRPDDLRRSLRQ